MLWLLLAGLGLATVSQLLKRRKVHNLSDMHDEDFLRIYKKKFLGSDKIVIDERKSIAKHIGLPYKKLSPDHRFDELSMYTGFVGEYEVGMGDLADELTELCERAAMTKPQPFPNTVGEFIHEVARIKDELAARTP